MPEIDLVGLDPAMRVEEARAAVVLEIEAAAPECLIVDTFPRGLAGELADFIPSFGGRKVLVQRDLNPEYRAAFQLDEYIHDHYDLVLVPGDAGVDPSPRSIVTAPWVVRSWEELPDRDRARQMLNLGGTKPCVVVCAAGNPDELHWYGSVAALLAESAELCSVRCIAPVRPEECPLECWVRYWPAIDLYSAADVVVGGAGYNTIHECLACGVPLIARPWPRKYDRQGRRAAWAASQGRVTIVDEPRQACLAALTACGTARGTKRYHNGATDAVGLLNF
jgi:hypothetical protein